MIRVLVVAEARTSREALAHCLRDDLRLNVLPAASADAREWVREADVALVDISGDEGRRLAGQLKRESPHIRVIAVGVPDCEADVLAWAEIGVDGYTTTDDSIDSLRAIVFSVLRGETLCTPRMAAALLRRVATLAAAQPSRRDEALTSRENQVAELLASGLSNKEIAQALSIEVATVKNHVHSILGKLDVQRRGQAALRIAATGHFHV